MKKFLIMLCWVLCLTGCKKNDAEPDNFLFAKIDGRGWTANVLNSEHAHVSATITQGLVVIAAEQDAGSTRTSLGIIFPKSMVIGQEIEFNSGQKMIVAFATTASDAYVIDSNNGVSGKLLVSKLDEAHGVVEGRFSGTAVHSKNGSKLEIQDGQFRSKIYQGTVTTNPGKK